MARAKSVVLTPAEKKAAVKTLKGDIKVADSTVKAAVKAKAAEDKAYAAKTKVLVKDIAAKTKAAETLKAKLAALTA